MVESHRAEPVTEQQRRIESRQATAAQRGDRRHDELNAEIAVAAERLAAVETLIGDLHRAVDALEAAVSAHRTDDKRHTGKPGKAI